MHVKSLSQGLNVDLAQPGLEPGTSWSRSQVSTTRPQRHYPLKKKTQWKLSHKKYACRKTAQIVLLLVAVRQ